MKRGTHLRWRCPDCGAKYVELPKMLNEFGKLKSVQRCLRDAPEEEQYLARGYRVFCFGELEAIEK